MNESRHPRRRARRQLFASALLGVLVPMPPAEAHPHIFVDTEIGFVVGAGQVLEALQITWRFDAFHTLYTLAAEGIARDADGGLADADSAFLAEQYADWSPGFDGFAKLLSGGDSVALDTPAGLEVDLADDMLRVRFTRQVIEPIALAAGEAEISVYEGTYYYAATVAAMPEIHGEAAGCGVRMELFDPNNVELAAVQTSLMALSREETPENPSIGALFADRVFLACD
ncbi:MAG: DUF1007 family protein [Pseudomonadota bacterium]